MTKKQWEYMQASLNSVRLLMFALAKTSPNSAALREVFLQDREILETALLNSRSSETSIEMQRKKFDEIEKALWD